MELCNFYIFWFFKLFPMCCIFNVQFDGYVANGIDGSFVFRAAVVLLSGFEVDELESLLGVVDYSDPSFLIFSDELVIIENDRGSPKQFAFFSNLFDLFRLGQPSLREEEVPIQKVCFCFLHRFQKDLKYNPNLIYRI